MRGCHSAKAPCQLEGPTRMIRRLVVITLPLMAVALVAVQGQLHAAAQLPPVRILTPAPDSVVRELVPIQIPIACVPDKAYMVVQIDGRFRAAVARPRNGTKVTFVWDTKGSSAGNEQVPDGVHEIRVLVADQNGNQVGNSDMLRVRVKNSLDSPPQQVLLFYRFRPNEQRLYSQRTVAKNAGVEAFSNHLIIRRACDDVMPGGIGLIREKIERDSRQTDANQTVPFYKAGRSLVMDVAPDGKIFPGRRMKRLGEQAALQFLELPNRPLRVGDTWESHIRIPLFYNGIDVLDFPTAQEAAKEKGNWALALAKNKVQSILKGFEWQSGHQTAKITTKYDGAATYMLPGALTPILIPIMGERTTYLDFREGKVVRVEEKAFVDLSTASGASAASVPTVTAPGASSYSPGGYPPGGANPYASYRPGGGYGYRPPVASPYPGSYPGSSYSASTDAGNAASIESTRTQVEISVSLIG